MLIADPIKNLMKRKTGESQIGVYGTLRDSLLVFGEELIGTMNVRKEVGFWHGTKISRFVALAGRLRL